MERASRPSTCCPGFCRLTLLARNGRNHSVSSASIQRRRHCVGAVAQVTCPLRCTHLRDRLRTTDLCGGVELERESSTLAATKIAIVPVLNNPRREPNHETVTIKLLYSSSLFLNLPFPGR